MEQKTLSLTGEVVYCPDCKQNRPVKDFHSNKSRKNGYSCYCRECTSIRNRQRRSLPESPARQREAFIKWKYGISQKEYLEILENQGYKCAICGVDHQETKRPGNLKHSGESFGLCIDHCHTTGKVRGLLCNQCNRALGLFQDSSYILQKAKEYLDE